VAIGEFEVEPERDRAPDWAAIERDLRAALLDPTVIREQLAARHRRYHSFSRPTAARPAEPRVFVDNDATDVATIVEVRAADGIGVLARIADTFARHGVRVDQAYASTLGHEVVDSFYVTLGDGAKLTDAETIAVIQRELLQMLDPTGFAQSDDELR
jgi:[protein-PII] uridylyltransferase